MNSKKCLVCQKIKTTKVTMLKGKIELRLCPSHSLELAEIGAFLFSEKYSSFDSYLISQGYQITQEDLGFSSKHYKIIKRD